MTVDEFVGETLAACADLQGLQPIEECWAAFALGALAGAALHERMVFPLPYVEAAVRCRSQADFREFEALLKTHRGAN